MVVLSLALGIGANTAIFSLIDSLLLKSLPVRDPDRLVRIVDASFTTHGIPVFRQIAESNVFDSTAAMSLLRPDISEHARAAQRVRYRRQRRILRDARRVTPAIGRLLTPEDDRPGTPAVAVTDYEFWQAEFGGRPDILGATIRLDGKPFTIVGVTERGFFGLNVGRRFDVAIALNGYRTLYPDSIDEISNSFAIIGRLETRADRRRSRGGSCARCSHGIRAALQLRDNVPSLDASRSSVQSIASGLSHDDAGAICAAAHRADGARRPGAADRVHQRREPVDRARQRAARRARGAPVARRHSRAGAAIAR